MPTVDPQLTPILDLFGGELPVNHAYGTAEHALTYAERLQEIGVDDVMLMIQMGTVPQEVCMETIRQWGEKIIPRFR